MKKLQQIGLLMISLVLVLSINGMSSPVPVFAGPYESPDLNIHSWGGSSETQVAFFAGYVCGSRGNSACYINQLKIGGINQYGEPTTWKSSWKSKPEFSIAKYDWWWKPNNNIHLDFHVSGYGWRSCSINAPKPQRGYYIWVHITYTGNNTCSYHFSPYRW